MTAVKTLLIVSGAFVLQGCQGILSGVYDDPTYDQGTIKDSQLYVDASAWDKWHYIDLAAPDQNWQTFDIPCYGQKGVSDVTEPEAPGIYTYWYDVFGAGISNNEFRGFVSTDVQQQPAKWTFAVHRNNVRTNGCGVYESAYTTLMELPAGKAWAEKLDYTEDSWNQTDVWTVQDRMLSGIIGNQGIRINNVLGKWLEMEIPPMPPAFSINRHVFILKLADGSFAALQLADYMSDAGTKCCLTINYKYPL